MDEAFRLERQFLQLEFLLERSPSRNRTLQRNRDVLEAVRSRPASELLRE
jgi:hypothetical protein